MSKEYLSNNEIIERLKTFYGVSSDSALGERLDCSRQTIYQFKKGQEADIKIKIICGLLERLAG